MMRRLLHALALGIGWGWMSVTQAAPLDSIYDARDLDPLQSRYRRGWLDNYQNVFWPRLKPDEQARLQPVRFHMPPIAAGLEPLGFFTAGDAIFASIASIRFLEDVALAHTWLDMNGYDTRTVADYLLMLRSWKETKGRPPGPLAALCVPEFGKAGERVEERARRVFDTVVVFAMLHELGHVFHRHHGNRSVAPERSRANEEAADRFALDLFERIREVPLGLPLLFFTMAHLFENRADFESEEAYQRALAARTHPLSPARLQSLARHLTAGTASYAGSFRPGARATALSVALEISQLALLMADPDVQRLSAKIGQTVEPGDLAPRPRGRLLAAPCGLQFGHDKPFHGSFRGQITDGKTPLDVDVVLTRNDDKVVGSYSFGAGYGRLEGTVEGSSLRYRWILPPDSGQGMIMLQDGTYRGAWGHGRWSASGSILLEAAR
ncbi:MAG TPA: hypothetical protein VHG30_14565 [Microvirga sp.]|nr:hypothetical protein [Microvirga sp.]